MSQVLWSAVWPAARIGDAQLELARAAGLLPSHTAASPSANPGAPDLQALDHWLCVLAETHGLRAQSVECRYGELRATLQRIAPALIVTELDGQHVVLAVLRSSRRRLVLLSPTLHELALPHGQLDELLTGDRAREPRQRIERWLCSMPLRPRRSRRAREALLDLALEQQPIRGLWLLRSDFGGPFLRQLHVRGTLARAILTAVCALGQVAFSLTGWGLLGRGAMQGRIEPAWLAGWLLTLLSALALQLGSLWLGGAVFHELGALLRQRLMCGALRADPDLIRKQGSGRLLAIVSESEVLEIAGFGGAFATLLAFLQLLGAAGVLALGAGGALHVALLLGWCAIVAAWARRYARARLPWSTGRLELARSFLENVIGQRTRVVQQPEARWHLKEDRAVHAQLAAAAELDTRYVNLASLPARGWLLLGLLGLVPALLARSSELSLAIALGGVLQASAAFGVVASGAVSLTSARVAWTLLARLFRAATRGTPAADTCLALASVSVARSRRSPGDALLEARGLLFRYRPGGEPVLRECDLALRVGDRVLLEGASGGGKSTLAALLVGLRSAEAGHILIGGLDRSLLGASGWRRRIASAPQFHENHLLSASLAFNLLMGRHWPPSPQDRLEAATVCAELGLDTLIGKMPCGLDQVVGETGWQLSHGERSRVFLARALLQGCEVIVLDESFGALDPDTLTRCMRSVLARSAALLVIAHP